MSENRKTEPAAFDFTPREEKVDDRWRLRAYKIPETLYLRLCNRATSLQMPLDGLLNDMLGEQLRLPRLSAEETAYGTAEADGYARSMY